jgi:hypothetical protein
MWEFCLSGRISGGLVIENEDKVLEFAEHYGILLKPSGQ